MNNPTPVANYAEFWLLYLREHSREDTRAWHVAGTCAAIIVFGMALALSLPGLFAAALLAGYGPAWISHAIVECNRPATFRYPFWSLISDLRMTKAWLAGGLKRELQKACV